MLSVANTERAVEWQTCPLSLPVSELAELAETGKPLRVRFPPELMGLLMAETGTEREVEICMPAVQERVLDWALALAAAGVQGDSMCVTPQERQQAQQVAPVSIHIGGNATGVQIQLNSPGGQQQQTVTGEYKADALIALLQQVVAEGMLSGRSADQLFSPAGAGQRPHAELAGVGTLASCVRGILEGACGTDAGVAGHLDR